MVKRQTDGSLLWGVVVEAEAYSQGGPTFTGCLRRYWSNETLYCKPNQSHKADLNQAFDNHFKPTLISHELLPVAQFY